MGSRLGDGAGGIRLAGEQGTGSGGGTVTGSDGVTVAAGNATNDLVTGVDVAQVNIDSLGAVRIDMPSGGAAGFILTVDAGGGAGVNPVLTMGVGGGAGGTRTTLESNQIILNGAATVDVNANGGTLSLTATDNVDIVAGGDAFVNVGGDAIVRSANGGGIVLDTDGAGTPSAGEIALVADTGMFLTAGTGGGAGNVTITGGAAANGLVSLEAQGNNHITLTTAGTGDLNLGISHDVIGTIGRNFQITTAGSGGISLISDHTTAPINIQSDGALTLTAGFDGGAGDITIANNNGNGDIDIIAATQLSLNGDNIKLFDGTGTGQWVAIPDASGGTVIDAEARTALNALLADLRLRGDLNT